MANSNLRNIPTQEYYNPRWFIWTIVFLVVTGISLVSYIVLSDAGSNDVPEFSPSKSLIKNKR